MHIHLAKFLHIHLEKFLVSRQRVLVKGKELGNRVKMRISEMVFLTKGDSHQDLSSLVVVGGWSHRQHSGVTNQVRSQNKINEQNPET